MAQKFSAAKFNRDLRAAQRKAQSQVNRDVDRANRENQRKVDAHNRTANQHNRRVISDYNNQVSKANAQNRSVIADLNKRLRSPSAGPARYTPEEMVLADRVHEAASRRDDREWDIFLSYARIDGYEIGNLLREALESLGLRVWFDEISIVPGKSQALQMDQGLRKARAGIVVLTPAYLVGRFWTERELGALLHKDMLVPVLHKVSFHQVSEYSGILPDLAGFETTRDDIEIIAEKIAAAVSQD